MLASGLILGMRRASALLNRLAGRTRGAAHAALLLSLIGVGCAQAGPPVSTTTPAATAPEWASAPARASAPAAPPAPLASLLPFTQGQASSSRQSQLAATGYSEEEWRLRGQAQSYVADGEWHDDGLWGVKAAHPPQPYETRILVRRPKDPARFNGIVLVEWMNTALSFDLDGGWLLNRDEILRQGYAWVGVSAEAQSVSFLKGLNPTRYAQARAEDNNGQSFDIYTQAARLIRQTAPQWGLAGQADAKHPVRLLALGYSQSGSYLITYLNAFQPWTHAFDGFYLMSTAAVGMPLTTAGSRYFSPQYRATPQAPVMQVSTEMEVMVGWQLSRTPDTNALRHWEIPGASHLDKYMQQETLAVDLSGKALQMPHCRKPTNTLPARLFNHAALRALRTWVTEGKAPPIAPRMQRTRLGFVQDDEYGNALGGLRLPDLDVPLAQHGMYSNFPSSQWSMWSFYACMAGGSRNPLPIEVVRKLYPTDQAYFDAYKKAADKLLSQGFLLPEDHASLLAYARTIKPNDGSLAH
ncbi:hypothetical protein JY96_18955 [Aquabacterium sp. NJ1]|nr:hypothetical protein JY96_18955 [Aquabacterium sp. NJ1]